MSKASKGIFANIAQIEGIEYFTASQVKLMRGVSPPADLVIPFAASGSTADSSAAAVSLAISESPADSQLEVVDLSEAESFGLPCITDEKLLVMMARDSVNGAGLAESAGDRHFAAGSGIEDEAADLPIAVGGSATGIIDVTGDTDTLTVTLEAGQRYMISLRGTGAAALKDTFLEVFDPSMVLVNSDDDGGLGTNSLMTITAATSGTYTIRASAFANPGDPGVGEYTVDVRQMGVDSVPSSLAGAVTLNQGITFGFRETSANAATTANGQDVDLYKVTLEAGKLYTFSVAGGADYATSASNIPVGEINTLLTLFSPSGTQIAGAQSNNISSSDLSSSFSYFAQTSGTYYLDVRGFGNGGLPGRNTGGWIIEFKETAFSELDPLDSINWNNAANIPTVLVDGVPTAYVYFAAAGENFGENARAGDPTQPASGGNGTLVSYGWTEYEKTQLMLALQEYTKILGINFVETANSGQATFRVITNSSLAYGAYAYPQDPAYGTQKGIMVFNVDNRGWNLDSADPAVTTDGLGKGGYAWGTILHEVGHAMGLSHPHDTGGGSQVMAGVSGAQGSLGVFNLNQQVYTQMSYNGGWWSHPDGSITGTDPTGFRSDSGWLATLGAFDIAQLQARYGVTPAHATGDNVYVLPESNGEGTYFETLYDTGGIDTIVYNGSRGAQIDLGTATLDYSPTGGGRMSFVRNLAGETAAQAIKGGFTIANGVVIENATGGSGNDVLIGNDVGNVLTGNDGNDGFMGRGGNDTIVGGAGADTAHYDGVRSHYSVTATVTNGVVTGYTVTDVFPADAAPVNDEGTDTLSGVESIQFTDMTMSLSGPVLLYDGGGALVGAYPTLQSAIDAASDGYTVWASAGTYDETINVNKDVTIEGPNAGVAGTGARGDEAIINGQVTISAAGVTIDGVKLVGASAGSLGNTAVEVLANGFTLTNSVLDGSGDVAVITSAVTGLDVGHNLIQGYSIGLYVSGPDTAGSIHDNRFQGAGGAATGLGNGVNSETSHVTIANNLFDGLYAGSLNLFPFGPDTVDLNDYVTGNTITNSGPARPVQILPTQQTHNILGTDYNEAFDGETAAGSYGVTGAFSFDGRGGDDRAWGAGEADSLTGGSGDDRLFGNGGGDTLSGGTGNDLVEGGAGDDTLAGGDDSDTAVYGGARSGYAVTATSDSNGRVTGFSAVDDTDAGDGDSGTDSLSGIEKLQFDDVTLDLAQPVQLFDGSGNLVGTFGTIQAAVDSAAGGYTVRVAAGTYAETVTVDQDITIEGSNVGVAAGGARGAESIIDGGVHMHAAGATLDGLTILGGGTLAGNPAGIYVDVDDVTLTNLVVQGDGSVGTGIVTPYGAGVTGLELSGSRIDDWSNGTYFNPSTQFSATGNSFDGNFVAITGDDWAAGTNIAGNSFTNSGGIHVGYGSFDTAEDVGAYFGAGNVYDGAGRHISVSAYGDGTPGGQTIHGTEGKDSISGQEFVAGSGNDATFHGRGGDDRLSGNAGNDTLHGDEGNDDLRGGSGDDVLDGGAGNDTLNGGTGIDRIVLADSGFTIAPLFDPNVAGPQTGWTVTTASGGTDTLNGVEIIDSGASGNVLLVGGGGFTTIQAAVDAAQDGDTILVASGTYAETVTVNKDITISGMNSGIPAGPGRNPESIIDGGVYMHAAGATLDGLTILGGGTLAGNPAGIYVDADDVTLTNLIVQGDGSVGTGIVTPSGGGVSGLVLSDSRIDDWTNGTYFNPTTQFTANGNSFDGNGVALTGDDWDDGTLILGNQFTNSSAGHVGYGAFDSIDDIGAYFGPGNTFDASGGRIGIFAYGDGTPGGQDVTGTQFGDYMAGAEYVPGSGDGATFRGAGGDDYIDAGAGDDTLDGGTGADTMVGGAGNDVYVVDSASDVVTEDPAAGTDEVRTGLSSYSLAGLPNVENLTGLGTADQSLTGNGGDNRIDGGAGNDSIDGAGGTDTARYAGAATITENATGWTVTDAGGTDMLENVEIVDDGAAGKTLLVGNGGYSTIQEAIDAASDGDTILVSSGTYAENLNVDKDVTILGPNHGVAGTGTRAAEAVIDGQVVINAAGVTIDGVRLVGAAAGSLGTTAVEVKANDFTLLNSVLAGTGDTAIVTGSVTGLDIARNLIMGYAIGAYVAGGNTSGSIHDNRFQGNGDGATGLGNGVNSESSHVAIANNAFDGLYAGSLNIFPFGPDSVDLNSYIVGNTITNSTPARPVQILPTNFTHNIVGTDHNEAFDGETAAASYGVTGAFSFDGRGGADHAWGGEEGDTLTGGAGNDQLFGNGGDDTLNGGDDNDSVSGGEGADSVHGGNGNDSVSGGAGNDILTGGAGVDTLTGGEDSDSLDGGSGADSLDGGDGDDTLYGGAGNDMLHGGSGAAGGTDTAVYDGHRGDYSITMITGAGGRIVGFSTVSDNEPGNGNEGVDSLISVERLQFSNRTLDATLPVQLFDQNNQLIGTFTTIQAAIDGAQDNYTIRVAAGTYDEDLTIDVGVRILGARVSAVTGRDAAGGVGETTIIGHAKIIAEDNVTLTGLRFLNDATTTGGGAANPTVQILTGGGAQGHLISNSIFWSTVVGGANGVDDRAISAPLIPDGQITLTGNLISGSSEGLFSTASWGRGIWMDGGGVAFSASGNIVEWTRSGLVLDGAGGSVYFVTNNILRNLGTAFSIATSEDGLVEAGNTFRNVGDEYNFRNLSEDVTFDAGLSGNTVQAVGTSNDVVVILGGSGNDTLTGTSGADHIDANNRPGHLNVEDSDVLNGGDGNDVLLGRFGADTLNGGTGEDSLDGGDGSDVLNGNEDSDTLNGGAGDDSLSGGAGDDTLDGGTGVDTAVVGTGPVYTPTGTSWTVTSSQGTDTLTNVEIVDSGPGPNVLLVGSGGFATIQAAVDAASDGDTILVAAGTYVEQVVVEGIDDLTIVAVDGAQVTIQAPADLVETARSSSDREIHAVLTAKDSSNLTIRNIDIDGAGRGDTIDEGGGAGDANFYGVYYRNSSGSLFDVDIAGVRDPYPGGTAAGGQPLVSGVQRGVALVVDNDALLAFTMIGGSISDFQKNATVFNRAELNFAGVTITGGGAQTVNAQNGIVVANSTGSISASTITGIGYAGPADVYSGAILSSGNTNLTIAGNVITGANIDSPAAKVVGIWVYQTGAPNSGGMIVGNSISHVDEGIDVTGDIAPDPIQIENNSISNVDGTDNDPLGVYFAPNPALATAHDIDGSDGHDSLAGGAGNDTLSGLDGNDALTGNGGDDTLNGDGGGEDVAVYNGPRGGYSVTAVTDSNGLVTGFSAVDDTDAGNGDEGTDTLTGVERLQFGDVTLDLADPVQLFDDGGQLVGTFGTIQAAVDEAASGYTIRVAAGTYAELVTVDEDVTILGPNAGAAGAGTRVGEAVVDGFYMHAAGATLDGLTILGGGILAGNPAGIYVDADGVVLTNLIIEGNGTAGPGILTPYGGEVTGLVLSRSLVTGWSQGAYFNPTTGFVVFDNSFDGNGNAILGDDWDDATLIEVNSFTNSVGSHIGYGALDTIDDVGAYFGSGNTFGGTNRPTSIFAYGDGTPAGQTVYGTELSNLMRGETAGETYVFHGRGGDDRLIGNDGDDILDGGAGNDTMVGGAGVDTVVLADSTFTISPAADADPSTAGNQPGWTVTTSSEGTDSLSGIEIVDSGAPGKVLLVGQGGFATIQAAVDAASDGDTILVASGTYAETVTVNKDITISGMNSGIPAGDPRNPETVIDGGVHMNAAGATLDGLTILGGASLAGNPAGIYVDADDVTLKNLIVQGDGSAGTGIVTPHNGGVTGLVLEDSRIDDWTNGTYFNPTTQFTATGNSFDGNGVALTGDDWDDGTLISGNSFTNSSFGHVGYGVMDPVEDVGAFFGAGNSFDASGGRIGIFAYGTGQDITGTAFGDYMADTVAGSGGTFHGEGGDDYIDAGSGDDTLEGGAGDDTLDGGADSDTAVYAGNSSDYTVTVVTDSNGAVIGYSSVVDNNAADGDDGSDTLIGIEHLQFADGPFIPNLAVKLYDDSDNLVGSFVTIQEAINQASDNYTIRVDAGTYDEDLVIDVGVAILGAEAGNAVGGRDAGGGTGETTIIGHAHVTATANVTLDGLRFLNDGTTTGGGSANPTLQFQTGGGAEGHLVTNSIFWSAVAGGTADDRAISTVAIGDGLITITDNLISGASQGQFDTASWGRGIWFDGGGVDLVVTGNTIEWSRTGLNLDMSGDSTANVSDNSFRGLGTGMALATDADGLTVAANDIERVGTEFSFRNLTTGVTFNAGAAIGTLTTVGDSNDLVVVLGGSGHDSLTGTEGADRLDGNNSPTDPGAADTDVLNGLGGNDTLFGRGGNDTLDGGAGDDAMTGGTGDDVYVVDTTGDSITEASGEGTDEVRTALATYALAAELENLTGLGDVDQNLTGNASDNVIDGGAGADAMTGGAGNDIYVVDDAGDTVTELAGEGTDEIRTSLSTYTLAALANVENLTGTNAAGQTLTGNGSVNVITGAAGNDVIDGGAGADTMAGGAGNDLYFVDNAGDVVVELPGASEGVDEVRTGLAAYSIVNTAVENLTATSNVNHDFRGNSGSNVITGGGGNDLLRLYDGGDDTVIAGDGLDNIFFGGTLTAADVVNGGGGVDTLVIQGNYSGGLTMSANVTQIENISILAGSNASFGETGNNRYDYVLVTNDANFAAGVQARINGAALLADEDFTFNGSAETDASFVVYGGKGKDTLLGGFGNDIFIYAEERFQAGDTVNGGPGGYDGIFFRGNYTIDFNAPGYFGLMSSIENMTLTSATDERYARGGGTEFDYNITLADNMLLAGVELTVSGALLMATETMILDGSLETDGFFRLFGGRASDILKGGAQNDLLHGNLGADQLTGGGGVDTFRYDNVTHSNSGSLDQILDFTPGTDKIDLSRVDANSLVAGNQAFTWIGSNAFTGSGAASAGQLRAFQSGGTWMVEGDTNGDGVGDLVIQLTLQGPTPLSASDFFL